MDPATITAIAKAAVAALSDEKIRKTIGWVIAAILSPLILIVVLICSLLSGTANHNNTAVDLTFNGGVISGQVPEEYRAYITEMRGCFTALEGAISEVESMMEDGGSLDEIRVKAIFYVLNFGRQAAAGNLRHEAQGVVDCFVTYEERTRTVTGTDENGEEYEHEETYIVAVLIADLPTIYANVAAEIGRAIIPEDQANVTEIYLRVKYNNFDVGADMSLEGGNGTHELIGELADPNAPLPRARSAVRSLMVGGQKSLPSLATAQIRLAVVAARGIRGLTWAHQRALPSVLCRAERCYLSATKPPATAITSPLTTAEGWSRSTVIAPKF